MKRFLPHIVVVAMVASVPVLAQVTLPKQRVVTPKPQIQIVQPKWTPFEYQVFEITDPPANRTGGVGLGLGQPTLDSEGRLVWSRPPSPIEIGNAQFQELSNEMGKKGWELIQLSPRNEGGTTKSYRAVFKREQKPVMIKPSGG